MGKRPRLNPSPRLPALPPRLGHAPGDDKARDRVRLRNQPWRSWYKLKLWEDLRWQVLTRDLFKCQICKRTIAEKGQAVADHIKAHRGDRSLFWNPTNLQCLCAGCHDTVKQREERGMLRW